MKKGDDVIELLKLKNDYTFKRVFGFNGNEKITKGLLNSILEEEVTEVNLDCDKILEREIYNDKLGILDIRAKINENIDCNIEMQLVDYKNIEKRALYYVSRMYSRALKKSQDYADINKCIGIVFIDFKLEKLEEVPKYITKWNFRESEYRKIVLTDVIELYIIEMPKVKQYDKNSTLDTWVKFIINSEVVDMEEIEEIKQARKVLEEISKDENERYLADLREKYVLDMNSIRSESLRNGMKQGLKEGLEQGMKEGREKGLREGKEKGIIEGKEQEKNELAKKMKKRGFDISTIIEITSLTKEQIESI